MRFGRTKLEYTDSAENEWRIDSEEPAPALLTELERVFHANHLDALRPLSATSYADWRKTIHPESEIVTEIALQDQSRGLKLTTVVTGPHAADAIIEASLIVRRADWHPVAEHLKVQGQNEVREYELSEAAYEVMPLAALTVFAEPAPTPLPTATPAAEPTRIPAPAPSMKPVPTEAELRNAEVAALYALHRIRADLGEQIEILRDPAGQVVVRGLVETADRREQLIDALHDLAMVTMQIQTVEEAQRVALKKLPTSTEPAVSALSGGSEQASVSDRDPRPDAFRAALERYFASSGGASPRALGRRITELTNRALALSESALSRAWALRRLAENPSLKQTERLSPEAKTRLVAMIESHRTGLLEEIRSLIGEIESPLTFIADGAKDRRESLAEKAADNAIDTTSDWAVTAQTVFQSVSRLDRALHWIFSSGGQAPEPAVVARQSLADFAEIETAARLLGNQTGRIAAEK